jgi:RNA polymerase sigma-70 factor (sigma-E family)
VGQEPRDFAEFYASAKDDCLRAVLAAISDKQSAEDLVAEAFASAWVAWRKVSRHPAPQAWVVRTALNTHVSWWRRRRREVALTEHESAKISCTAGALSQVDSGLMAALSRLSVRQRQVIALRLFLDLDTAQTAEMLGIAPGTVTAHLARAIASLRHEYARLQEGAASDA